MGIVLIEAVNLAPCTDVGPYTVRADMPFYRAHALFFRLALRHLVVVDECSKPVGVLTRASFINHHSDHDDDAEEEAVEETSHKLGHVPAGGQLGREVDGGS